jgi:hypothetical protein
MVLEAAVMAALAGLLTVLLTRADTLRIDCRLAAGILSQT